MNPWQVVISGLAYIYLTWPRYNTVNFPLTHWGRVMHICVSKIIIIGSDNGLSPGRRQAIIWPIAGILLFRPSGTKFSKILIKFKRYHSRKCIWKCHLQNGGHFVRHEVGTTFSSLTFANLEMQNLMPTSHRFHTNANRRMLQWNLSITTT